MGLKTRAELDLVFRGRDTFLGFEIKRAEAQRSTRLMRTAIENLGLESLDVIYPGDKRHSQVDRVTFKPLAALITDSSEQERNAAKDSPR